MRHLAEQKFGLDADPINPTTGEQFLDWDLARIAGPLSDLTISSHYSSRNNFLGATGWGIATILDERIFVDKDSQGNVSGYTRRNSVGLLEKFDATGQPLGHNHNRPLRISLGSSDTLYTLLTGYKVLQYDNLGRLRYIRSIDNRMDGFAFVYSTVNRADAQAISGNGNNAKTPMINAREYRPNQIIPLDPSTGVGTTDPNQVIRLTWSMVDGLLDQVSTPGLGAANLSRDINGNLIKIIHQNGSVRVWQYGTGSMRHLPLCFTPFPVSQDTLNQYPLCSSDTTKYSNSIWTKDIWDSVGHVTTQWTRSGKFSFKYNGFGNLISDSTGVHGYVTRPNQLSVTYKDVSYNSQFLPGNLSKYTSQNSMNLSDFNRVFEKNIISTSPMNYANLDSLSLTANLQPWFSNINNYQIATNYYDAKGYLIGSINHLISQSLGMPDGQKFWFRDNLGRDTLELELVIANDHDYWRYARKTYLADSSSPYKRRVKAKVAKVELKKG